MKMRKTAFALLWLLFLVVDSEPGCKTAVVVNEDKNGNKDLVNVDLETGRTERLCLLPKYLEVYGLAIDGSGNSASYYALGKTFYAGAQYVYLITPATKKRKTADVKVLGVMENVYEAISLVTDKKGKMYTLGFDTLNGSNLYLFEVKIKKEKEEIKTKRIGLAYSGVGYINTDLSDLTIDSNNRLWLSVGITLSLIDLKTGERILTRDDNVIGAQSGNVVILPSWEKDELLSIQGCYSHGSGYDSCSPLTKNLRKVLPFGYESPTSYYPSESVKDGLNRLKLVKGGDALCS